MRSNEISKLSDDDKAVIQRSRRRRQDLFAPGVIICFGGTLEILGAGSLDTALSSALFFFAIGLPLNAVLGYIAIVEEADDLTASYTNLGASVLANICPTTGLQMVFFHFSNLLGIAFLVSLMSSVAIFSMWDKAIGAKMKEITKSLEDDFKSPEDATESKNELVNP